MMFSLYDPEQVITDYTNSQMKKARAEGLAKGQAAIAKNLLKQGLPVDRIAQATGLSSDEVAALSQ